MDHCAGDVVAGRSVLASCEGFFSGNDGGSSGFLLGNHLGVTAVHERQILSAQAGKSLRVSGKIVDDVRLSSSDEKSQFALSSLAIEGKDYEGKLWVSLSADNPANLKRGDQVEIKGFALPGFGAYGLSLGRAEITMLNATSANDPGA